ncbi:MULTISPECIES: hypothetical protein [Nocardioides]|uniref:hypothetical protein n=1 Tax=Nocardioides TaxID=1839 RepID=UPI0005644D92|nr:MULTISPECIES: hypothetical protein [Nocardioides]
MAINGGYDFQPQWLGGMHQVTGQIEKWIPGQDTQPACVVRLNEPLTATGDVRGKREQRTGVFVVLELRYIGQKWESSGNVHVELCDTEPDDNTWAERDVGAWVESHATYSFAG